MPRILFLFFFTLYTTCGWSASLYQIDIIFFSHAYTPSSEQETSSGPNIFSVTQGMMTLKQPHHGETSLYQRLPINRSSLQNAWYRLNQHTQYHTLLHDSWLQTSQNQHPVHIEAITTNGVHIDGALSVRQSNYYLLDTELHISMPGKPSFVFTQRQRLKPNTTYYLDHPQAGMLIRIRRV